MNDGTVEFLSLFVMSDAARAVIARGRGAFMT